MSITGRWRITEMEMWDQDAIDLVQPGFIEFGGDGLGQFGFIAVNAEMDCRDASVGQPRVEFSWEGNDDTSPASGRGWAVLNPDGSLDGHIYFHLGDDSSFRAAPFDAEPPRVAKNATGSAWGREWTGRRAALPGFTYHNLDPSCPCPITAPVAAQPGHDRPPPAA